MESGLDYRGARFYDSDIGRFLSLDPLAADYPSLSDYSYVAGNPIMFIDPTGKKVDDFYIDEDGNLLGEDGSDTNNVRVISKKSFEEISNSNDCSGGACGTNGTAELQQNSKLLSEYEKGISVSEDSWDYVTSNGGERLTPFVENNSSETIFYKPEGVEDGVNNNPHVNERGAFPIAPGTDLYSPADGVKTSNTPSGKVHRAPTGYRITVDANAEANVVNFPDWLYGYGEVTKNARRGGWANLVNSNPR